MDNVQRILISLIFLASGLAKLLALEFEVEAFARWQFPDGFRIFVGTLEVAAGVGIWVSKLKALVSLCLVVLMLGAMMTHARFGEWPMLLVATFILLLTGSYFWRHRRDLLPK